MWNWHNTRCPSRAHTATLQHDKDCWLWCLSYSIILSVPNLDGLQANLLLVILSCAPPAALSGPILQGHCSHLSWLSWDSLRCPEGSLGKKLLLCLVYSALLQCCIMGWCCVGAGSIQGSHATGRGDLTAPVGSDSHQRVGQQHLLRAQVLWHQPALSHCSQHTRANCCKASSRVRAQTEHEHCPCAPLLAFFTAPQTCIAVCQPFGKLQKKKSY